MTFTIIFADGFIIWAQEVSPIFSIAVFSNDQLGPPLAATYLFCSATMRGTQLIRHSKVLL